MWIGIDAKVHGMRNAVHLKGVCILGILDGPEVYPSWAIEIQRQFEGYHSYGRHVRLYGLQGGTSYTVAMSDD